MWPLTQRINTPLIQIWVEITWDGENETGSFSSPRLIYCLVFDLPVRFPPLLLFPINFKYFRGLLISPAWLRMPRLMQRCTRGFRWGVHFSTNPVAGEGKIKEREGDGFNSHPVLYVIRVWICSVDNKQSNHTFTFTPDSNMPCCLCSDSFFSMRLMN